jgi:exosortase C (VPDSG-CTERM-specific)
LHLVKFALHEELYSHILLIPFIAGFLVWTKRRELVSESRPSPQLGMLSLAVGGLILGGYWMAMKKGWAPGESDSLAVTTLAFLFFLLAGSFVFLGPKYLKVITFPVAFLLFCVPFPKVMEDGIEAFLQHGSAEVAATMLTLSGMPVLQTATHFQLPSFSLEVAPECSGIHATLILVITSLLAAYLFLQKPWNRLILMLIVVPLALLRNGFRIFVIAQLCVRIGPHMIDSPIHRRGGPVFFVLSLVPLFLLLIYLSKRELRKEQAVVVSPKK